MLSETEFHRLADATLLAIEDAVDALDQDIDIEGTGGILTLTLPNGSKIILNKQPPVRELWVAAKSGGYHCGRELDDWVCRTTGEALAELLARVLGEQLGARVTLRLT